MAHAIKVVTTNLPVGTVSVHLPNGASYPNGAVATLTDEEFALLTPTCLLTNNPTTGYLQDLGELGPGTTTGGLLPNNTGQTTLAGTTAGTALASAIYNGQFYKKIMVAFAGYENSTATAQTITFSALTGGANFTVVPAITFASGSGTPALTTATVTASVLTLPASMTAAATGFLFVEGY